MATNVITIVTPNAVDVSGSNVAEKLNKLVAVLTILARGPYVGVPSATGPVSQTVNSTTDSSGNVIAGGVVTVTLS